MVQQPLVGQGLIIEASRSNSDTPHSVGLLWTSHQSNVETSMPPAGFKPAIPASERLPDRTATGIGCRSKFKSVFFTYYLSMYQSWDRGDQHAAFGRLNGWSNTSQHTYYNRSTEHNAANSLAEKLFTNYNSSLSTQHTVNQSFSVF